MKTYFYILAVFGFILTGCGNIYSVQEVVAVDRIRVEGGKEFRYIGIRAPDKDNFYYSKSIEKHRALVLNKKVRIEKDAGIPDGYYVFVKDPENPAREILVGEELLLFGRAWLNEADMALYSKAHKPHYLDKMSHAEEVAKSTGEGVWERKP